MQGPGTATSQATELVFVVKLGIDKGQSILRILSTMNELQYGLIRANSVLFDELDWIVQKVDIDLLHIEQSSLLYTKQSNEPRLCLHRRPLPC